MTAIDHNIALLTQGQTHRVWSVIVTVFGDLVQGPGDEISAHALARIMARIGFKPEAVRVALHRLRKDGWIQSRRDGRASIYALTDLGRQQSAYASPRIYGATAPDPDIWHVIVGDGMSVERYVVDHGYLGLSPRAALGQGPVPDDLAPDLLALAGADLVVPDWLRDQVCPPDLAAAAAQLAKGVAQWHEVTPENPIDAAALRVLIVHSWRRVRLRAPDVPAALFPKDWQGAACRAQVETLLAGLPRPSLPMIEAAARED